MTRPPERGSALLITIFFISIIMLVALGFSAACRLERGSAHSHLERLRATELARTGLEDIIGTLRKETAYRFKAPDPDGVPRYYYRNYSTQPGALIVPAPPTGKPSDTTQATLREVKSLSSGKPTTLTHTDAVLDPPNLNVTTYENPDEPTYLITDQEDPSAPSGGAKRASEMRLKWIYVREDRSSGPRKQSEWKKVIDPVASGSEEPDLDPLRPIVGRYAYWADDESTKINYNLAWKREEGAQPNRARYAHPSRINLLALTLKNNRALTESMADSLHAFTASGNGHYFNSFADARQVSPEASAFLDYNRFALTHYSHDPDTTFFGEDRILLTTNRDLVPKVIDPITKKVKYTRKFLDIMRDDRPVAQLDPGRLDDIAGGQGDYSVNPNGGTKVPGGNKFDKAVKNLVRYISEKNWPLSPDRTFGEKYSYGKPSQGKKASEGRLGQLAVNIIDYVRSKESREPFVSPTRFAVNLANGEYSIAPEIAYGATDSFQGISRSPYFTEMAMYVSPTKVKKVIAVGKDKVTKEFLKYTIKFELHLPRNYEIPDGVDLVPDKGPVLSTNLNGVYFVRIPSIKNGGWYWESTAGATAGTMTTINTNTYAVPIMYQDVQGPNVNRSLIKPGDYVTVSKVFYREAKPEPPISTFGMRVALHRAIVGSDGYMLSPLNRWPRLNICPQSSATISYAIQGPMEDEVNLRSIETDDPRNNVAVKDWKYNKLSKNTFGSVNSLSTLGQDAPPTNPSGKSAPQQDTNNKNKLTDFSAYMPAPKGTVGTSNGPDKDNGVVTSIAELGYINTGADAVDGSVAWRSIRLQPNSMSEANTLPDWAFMDLFGVPSQSAAEKASPIFTPHGTSVGGRINVNSHVDPFHKMVRDRGLTAALMGTNRLRSAAAASEVATNIYNRTLASGLNKGKVYGFPFNQNPPSDAPNAFDTPGEICEIKGVADSGEESEDLVREIASLITSRGGVFSVYTIGQSIQQTPTGKLVVTGEQRQHAMVERYVENQGSIETDDDEVRFRTVYFRNLNP